MSKPCAFTFWQGVSGTPAYIELCLESHRSVLGDSFEVVELDMASLRD